MTLANQPHGSEQNGEPGEGGIISVSLEDIDSGLPADLVNMMVEGIDLAGEIDKVTAGIRRIESSVGSEFRTVLIDYLEGRSEYYEKIFKKVASGIFQPEFGEIRLRIGLKLGDDQELQVDKLIEQLEGKLKETVLSFSSSIVLAGDEKLAMLREAVSGKQLGMYNMAMILRSAADELSGKKHEGLKSANLKALEERFKVTDPQSEIGIEFQEMLSEFATTVWPENCAVSAEEGMPSFVLMEAPGSTVALSGEKEDLYMGLAKGVFQFDGYEDNPEPLIAAILIDRLAAHWIKLDRRMAKYPEDVRLSRYILGLSTMMKAGFDPEIPLEFIEDKGWLSAEDQFDPVNLDRLKTEIGELQSEAKATYFGSALDSAPTFDIGRLLDFVREA